MQNHISMDCRTAAVLLAAFALAGCATPREPAPAPEPMVEATPVPEAPAEPADTAPVTEAVVEAENAEPVVLKADAPLRYVVKKGDTLWGIANRYLRDSWQWPELWYVNGKVANPHLIYPGDELLLYVRGGRPQVARAGEGPADTPAAPVDEPPVTGPESALSPQVRVLPLDQAIFSIPLDAIRAFLRGPRVVDEDLLDDAPYVVDFDEERLMGGADNLAYVLQLEDRKTARWQVVHRGEKQIDPDDDDVIGFEVLPVGEAEVRAYGDPSTVYITRSDIETRAGDYLLPLETDPLAARFIPHAPDKAVNGRIISVYNGMSQIGQWQVVAINRGTQHGLEVGHVLQILQSGRESKDPYSFFKRSVQLPDVPAGQAMVFRTGKRLSYALVMSATRAIHLKDKVEKPEPGK